MVNGEEGQIFREWEKGAAMKKLWVAKQSRGAKRRKSNGGIGAIKKHPRLRGGKGKWVTL